MNFRIIDNDNINFHEYFNLFDSYSIDVWILLSQLFIDNQSVFEHSCRVGKLMEVLLAEIEILADDRDETILVSVLHDIGKFSIANSIF